MARQAWHITVMAALVAASVAGVSLPHPALGHASQHVRGDVATAEAATGKPDIVMMVIDDLGHNDIGYNDPQVKTPRLDKIASEGVKLANNYVYRFCSPSRSTFMSGRQPYHVGQQTKQNLNPTPGVACGINLTYSFLPKLLKTQGYHTVAQGKWHLGYMSDEYTPTYRGFDHYLGYYSGAEDHWDHSKAGATGHGMVTYWDLANNTGTDVAPCKDAVGQHGVYSSYLFGNDTQRIMSALDTDTPLFVYQAWDIAHDPCQAPQWAIDANSDVNNPTRRNFTAMMSALDVAADQLITDLEARSKASGRPYVLIVTTDNGGNLGGGGNNFPKRGGKYTFWNGGINGVAFVYSSMLPASMRGTTWHGLVSAADWYPTISGLAGASTDNSGPLPIDGVDIWSSLISNSSTPRDTLVVNVASADMNGKELNQSLGTVIEQSSGYKLLIGYPGWNNNKNWDGWVPLPTSTDESRSGDDSAYEEPAWCESKADWCNPVDPTVFYSDDEIPVADSLVERDADGLPTAIGKPPKYVKPCVAAPCLFNIYDDPNEKNDIASANPDVVARLTKAFNAAKATEVSLPESGLCPTQYGPGVDPRCAKKAEASGFWEPWL